MPRYILYLLSFFFMVSLDQNTYADSILCKDPLKKQEMTSQQQHRLLSLSYAIFEQLEQSNHSLALISRRGIPINEYGLRYSHMGFALKNNPQVAWGVLQLYYSCVESQSYLYDQGLTGFISAQKKGNVMISLLFLSPKYEKKLVEDTLVNRKEAKKVLSPNYSLNSYPFSTLYQNCDQWVLEVLAKAFANVNQHSDIQTRSEAQNWLLQHNYQPSNVYIKQWYKRLFPYFTKLLTQEDHPKKHGGNFVVTTPESIESFIYTLDEDLQRVEFCMTDTQIIIRKGWQKLDDNCQANTSDTIIDI